MEDAVAAGDELAAGGRDRSGLKALLPARGIDGYCEGQREGGREGSGTALCTPRRNTISERYALDRMDRVCEIRV